MRNPRLRILIADQDSGRRLILEKSLGYLGYHRVAPVRSLRDLVVLIDNSVMVFDLLIVSFELFEESGISINQLVDEHSCVRHKLVYRSALQQSVLTSISLPERCFSVYGLPDTNIIGRVIKSVEHDYENHYCFSKI